jgi:hypothetical protein
MLDRGKLSGFVCTEKNLTADWSGDNPERRANRFAADLLMPTYLFGPAAKNREITLATVRDLAREFQTSLTATAIRWVETGSFPSLVVCSTRAGIKWKARDRDLPEAIQLRDSPGIYTNAYELLQGKTPARNPVSVQADDWITHYAAKHYHIQEDSVLIYDGVVMSLLWWKDERPVIELEQDEE